MRFRRLLVTCALLAGCAAEPETPGEASAAAAIRAANGSPSGYLLRMDRVEKWYAARTNAALAIKAAPPLQDAYDALYEDEAAEAQAARLAAAPALADAITRAGLSVEEFVAITHAVDAARSVEEAESVAGIGAVAAATSNVPAGNLAFLRGHRDSLDRLEEGVTAAEGPTAEERAQWARERAAVEPRGEIGNRD